MMPPSVGGWSISINLMEINSTDVPRDLSPGWFKNLPSWQLRYHENMWNQKHHLVLSVCILTAYTAFMLSIVSNLEMFLCIRKELVHANINWLCIKTWPATGFCIHRSPGTCPLAHSGTAVPPVSPVATHFLSAMQEGLWVLHGFLSFWKYFQGSFPCSLHFNLLVQNLMWYQGMKIVKYSMYKVYSYSCIGRYIHGLWVLIFFPVCFYGFVLVCAVVDICSCVCRSVYGGETVILHHVSNVSFETASQIQGSASQVLHEDSNSVLTLVWHALPALADHRPPIPSRSDPVLISWSWLLTGSLILIEVFLYYFMGIENVPQYSRSLLNLGLWGGESLLCKLQLTGIPPGTAILEFYLKRLNGNYLHHYPVQQQISWNL